MTAEVPLTRGRVALVDDADLDSLLAMGKWQAARAPCGIYYARKNVKRGGRFTTIRMHSFLTGWSLVDHINGDGLDNRRVNLRPATSAQNAANRRVRIDSLSGLKGVAQLASGRWQSRIWVAGRWRMLGNYPDADSAARAYDAAALDVFGEFARLNFPTYDEAAL